MGIDLNSIITDQQAELKSKHAFLPDVGHLRPLFFRYCANRNGAVTEKPYRNIYISRVNSPDRPMTNEKQIEEKATALGFEVIRMEDYPLEEQIAISASAKSIMAPHGAGLANMVFAQPGCKIIELIPEKYMTPLFKQLAANCGHSYSVLIGKMDNSIDAQELHMPWQADCTRLETVVSSAAEHNIPTLLLHPTMETERVSKIRDAC